MITMQLTPTDIADAPQTEVARWLDAPQGANPEDVQLAGLVMAALGGAVAEGRTRELPLEPPLYVRLRRQLIRSGAITRDTVPHWPASDW